MILFIKNVGKDTTTAELKDYFDSLLSSWMPFCSRRVERVQLYTLYDSTSHLYDYHALCYINHDYQARKIINRSKLKPFKGRRLFMREFKLRTNQLFGPYDDDRRRGKRLHVVQHMQVQGYKEASRKF